MSITPGVIGCGIISQVHFPGLAYANARVAWVCDKHENTARPWAERFHARWKSDFTEIFSDDNVDAIHIATPSSTHPVICHVAIRGVTKEVRYTPVSPFNRAIAHFYRQIDPGEQGPQSRLTGCDVDELIKHIKQDAGSARRGDINWRIGVSTKGKEVDGEGPRAETVSALV